MIPDGRRVDEAVVLPNVLPCGSVACCLSSCKQRVSSPVPLPSNLKVAGLLCDDGSELDADSTVALATSAASSEDSAPLVMDICCATDVGGADMMSLTSLTPKSRLGRV
jgi:hypothetical protein